MQNLVSLAFIINHSSINSGSATPSSACYIHLFSLFFSEIFEYFINDLPHQLLWLLIKNADYALARSLKIFPRED